jgi:Stress responsive A/B Barrel Domain
VLIHVVCFKYRVSIAEGQRDAHRAKLAGLASLDGVVELKVGANVVESARSFDTGLVIRFADRAALDRYQQDARHVPIAQLGVSLSEQIVAVDFIA